MPTYATRSRRSSVRAPLSISTIRVGRHVRRFGLALPQPTGAQLAVLTIRHREAAAVVAQALEEIVRAFHAAGVTFALLEGAST